MAAEVKAILRRFDELQQARLPREAEWRQIAEYFMPRKDFSVTAKPNELIRRRVTSSVGPRSLERGSSLMVAYLVDQAAPFVGPNVDHALVRAGKSTKLSSESIDYLGRLEWLIFDAMMMPKSGYMTAVSQVAVELMGFGTGVMWTGRKRGFGPRYQMRPLRSCWIAANDEGEVDTLYFRYTMPADRVLMRFPAALENEALRKLGTDEKSATSDVTILHVVQPRKGGKPGAVAAGKPFECVQLAVEQKCVLEEMGYDSFPYQVPRIGVEEGSVYGTGLAWRALPDVMAYNFFQQGLEKAVALKNDPPVFKPGRMFPNGIDRRAGAATSYDPSALGFQRASEALQKLDIAGDPTVAAQYLDSLKRDIEEIFFIDWMSLNDGVQKTAEEIRDRRDLRIRAMSSLVPAVDRDLIGRGADRTLDVMVEEGLVEPPPAELANLDVGWDYKGPLAMMQQRGQFESIDRLFDLAAKGAGLDPNAVHVVKVDEGLRTAAEALGPPGGILRSRDEFEKVMASIAEKEAAKTDMEQVQQGSTSLRDAGQGISSLIGAGPGGGQGGRPQQEAA